MDARELVENAMEETGWSLEEIAERLDYKSLKRAMAGEIALPESRRIHLNDLILLRRAYGPRVVNPDDPELQVLAIPQPGSPPTTMPPHLIETSRLKEDPSVFGEPATGDYTEAVGLIGKLFHENPPSFRAALMMLRGLMGKDKTQR